MVPKSQPTITQEMDFSFPQNIPITYIWFGKEVPEDYLISLAELNFPVVFQKNPHIDRKFSREIMEIEKSDYYRLQYLYKHGGIYSDFDNIIDYPCLMKLLQPYREQDKLLFMSVGKHTREKMKQMTNGLIFAPYPKMPLLKTMLDKVDETKGKIWGFAGLKFLGTFPQPLEVDMSKCVIHTGDWSWFNASNQVLNKKRPPHSRFSKKLLKKKEIIEENIKLEEELEKEKKNEESLKKDFTKVNDQNKQLKQQIKQMNDKLLSEASSKKAQKESIEKSVDSKESIQKSVDSKESIQKSVDSKESIQKSVDSKESIQKSEDSPKQESLKKGNTSTIQANNKVEEILWAGDKLALQNQIEALTAKNSHLEFERDVSTLAVGSLLLVILLILGVILLKKRRNKGDFDRIGTIEKTQVSQRKIQSN